MKTLLGFDLVEDKAVPEGTIYVIPPDVKQGLEFLKAADLMRQHGIINNQLYDQVFETVLRKAQQAALEKRLVVIKNVGV